MRRTETKSRGRVFAVTSEIARMLFKRLMLAAAIATAAVATQAHADALDSIMKSKVIKITVTSAADLKGKTIGATRGAIEEQALTASAPPDATIKRFEDNNATIAAFVSGQVD